MKINCNPFGMKGLQPVGGFSCEDLAASGQLVQPGLWRAVFHEEESVALVASHDLSPAPRAILHEVLLSDVQIVAAITHGTFVCHPCIVLRDLPNDQQRAHVSPARRAEQDYCWLLLVWSDPDELCTVAVWTDFHWYHAPRRSVFLIPLQRTDHRCHVFEDRVAVWWTDPLSVVHGVFSA